MVYERFKYVAGEGFTVDGEYVPPSSVIEILNGQYDTIENLIGENVKLEKENGRLKLELDTHKHPLWSTRQAESKVNELVDIISELIEKNSELYDEINKLRIENMRLKALGDLV